MIESLTEDLDSIPRGLKYSSFVESFLERDVSWRL